MNLLALPNNPASSRAMVVFSDAADRAEFFSYPADEQEAVRDLCGAMLRIAGAANANQGTQAAAQPGRKGWSAKYLRALYDEWQAAGRDWRWLVDEARFPRAREAMFAPETEQWLIAELLRSQRTFKKGIQAVQAQWRAWWRSCERLGTPQGEEKSAIPGFTDAQGLPCCPPPCAGYLPRVLQDHNLYRLKNARVAPAAVEIVRYGSQAGLQMLPGIPRTREGVPWRRHVSWDDVWHDVMMHVPGYGPCRVLQFGAWEYSCSYYDERTFIQRARTPKNDGTWDQLKVRDFHWSLALDLEVNGWPLDWPMTILVENGTTTMSKAQAMWLHEFTEGQVTVAYNSMEGGTFAAWAEGKRGNSRAKAGHEGCHGILKNEMSHLRGHQGKDRDHTHAMEAGRMLEAKKLDGLLVQLPAEEQSRIVSGYLFADQFWRETYDALKRIHRRAEHTCEGFLQIPEWRPRNFTRALPAPWSELQPWLAAMPHVNEANLREYVEFFDRPETREERKARLSAQGRFMAPPSGALSVFYEDRFAAEKIKRDGSFECRLDGKVHRFLPPEPGFGPRPGEKVCGFLRPDGKEIHLFSGADGKNRKYLLTWPSEGKLRDDADSATRAGFFSRKQAHFNHSYEIASKATAEQTQAAREAHGNNRQVFAENGMVPERAENVREGCAANAQAVQEITAQRADAARTRRAARKIDIVGQTIRRGAQKRQDTSEQFA